MLDDLKLLHERDAQDALGKVGKQWQQLAQEYDVNDWQPAVEIWNVVHSGMGGTSLWALLSSNWPGYTLPVEVVRGYDAPLYVGPHTLFIVASYSGNTEETISALEQAEAKGAQIVVMTAGGKLAEIARQKHYLLITLPQVDKPRFGTLYGLKALVTLGEHLRLTTETIAVSQLTEADEFVKSSVETWQATVPTAHNLAKQLALEIIGKSAVVYSGPLLTPIAHKWKMSLNENAKNVAWEGTFPEFSHNEFTGWSAQPINKPYTVIYLQSSFDNDRIKKRFDLSDKLLSGRWPSPQRVEAVGETKLQQLLWTSALGDFVSLYTAFLNNVPPIDSVDKDMSEKLKKELSK